MYWKNWIQRVKKVMLSVKPLKGHFTQKKGPDSPNKVTSDNIDGINNMRAALVVGHSKDSQGACNCTYDICEWEFNDKLVRKIDDLVDTRCEITIVYRDRYKLLPDKVNALNPDFVICFHANAFNTKAVGCETLYYHKSVASKKMAKIFQDNLVNKLGLHNRGIKAKTTEERGGYMLRYVNAPCIILEPFFIDNDIECKKMSKDREKLAKTCRDSIYETIEKVM